MTPLLLYYFSPYLAPIILNFNNSLYFCTRLIIKAQNQRKMYTLTQWYDPKRTLLFYAITKLNLSTSLDSLV